MAHNNQPQIAQEQHNIDDVNIIVGDGNVLITTLASLQQPLKIA
jgi:hypothetical protein